MLLMIINLPTKSLFRALAGYTTPALLDGIHFRAFPEQVESIETANLSELNGEPVAVCSFFLLGTNMRIHGM